MTQRFGTGFRSFSNVLIQLVLTKLFNMSVLDGFSTKLSFSII